MNTRFAPLREAVCYLFLLLLTPFPGSGSACAQEFSIDAQCFIPFDHSMPIVAGIPLHSNVCILTELFGGDNRGFGGPGYRTRQLVRVRTIGDPIIVEGPFNVVGVTKAYLCSALDDGTVRNDQPCQEATGSNSGMSVSIQRLSERSIRVSLQGTVVDPLAPVYPGSAWLQSVDWCYTIVLLTRQDGTTTYAISGGHDNFPSYEVLVNSQPIHQFAAPANDPFLLAGDCNDVSVSGSGVIGGGGGGGGGGTRSIPVLSPIGLLLVVSLLALSGRQLLRR